MYFGIPPSSTTIRCFFVLLAHTRKVRAVEKEAQYLRERLETIPGEIKTENNRAWEQREQKLREAVGAEVG